MKKHNQHLKKMDKCFSLIKSVCPFFLLLSGVTNIFAAEAAKTDNSPHDMMETIQISDGYRIVVPKGAKVEKEGSQIKVEDFEGYILRKFADLEQRMKNLESNQNSFQENLTEKKRDAVSQFSELEQAVDSLKQLQENFQAELQQLSDALDDQPHQQPDNQYLELKQSILLLQQMISKFQNSLQEPKKEAPPEAGPKTPAKEPEKTETENPEAQN